MVTVQMNRTTDDLQRAVFTRNRAQVATLDYRRAIKQLDEQGRTQVEVARALRLSQPALSSALKAARKVPDVMPGFSGAGPYEICQRYAIGQVGRERLLNELSRWQYTPIPQPQWLDDVVSDPGPGSWAEVESAVEDGLIDDGIYDEVQRLRFTQTA